MTAEEEHLRAFAVMSQVFFGNSETVNADAAVERWEVDGD